MKFTLQIVILIIVRFFNLGERPGIKRANTIERIEELGKDVPFEVTIKRVLVLAQRGDWNGCEQALRYDSYILTSSTEFSIRMPSLHGLESFTPDNQPYSKQSEKDDFIGQSFLV